jgi:hypothetical protein
MELTDLKPGVIIRGPIIPAPIQTEAAGEGINPWYIELAVEQLGTHLDACR